MTRNLVIRLHGVGSNGVNLVTSLAFGAMRSRTLSSRHQMRPFCLATVPAVSGSKGGDRNQPAGTGGGGADGVYYTMAFL